MNIFSAHKKKNPAILEINRSVNLRQITTDEKFFLICRYDKSTLLRKMGFERIGGFFTSDFHGVKDYRSGVYFRK